MGMPLVAVAASIAFATPVGYRTHAIVHAAGGHRFSHFTKIGPPRNIFLWVMATLLIPRYFPFCPARARVESP